MGKAPSFQFYVRDWLSDPQLRMASHTTKGIWIDMLCLMWESCDRGKLEGTIDQFTRMLGAQKEDFEAFLKDAETTKFCNVTICNNNVTLINRRMLREQKERENTRLRVKRYRSNASCNGPVAVPSSSSSSNNKEGIRIPSSSTDGGPPDPPKSPKPDKTPHREIISAYHEILPELPCIQEGLWAGSTAERELRTRWKESPKRQDVEFWKNLFRYIRDCPWLMGQVSAGNGKPPFQADLRWIVNRTNFTKICEGRYEKK